MGICVMGGKVSIDDVREVVEALRTLSLEYGCVLQVVDADIVAGRPHLENALKYAKRAWEHGHAISKNLSLEVLLYVVGTRQIKDAKRFGIRGGDQRIAIVVEGDME